MAKLTAKKADKHKLYETSVQCVEADIDFVIKTFKKCRDRKPRLLKEDFCGTASAAVEFVSRSKKNRAIGVDLEQSVLDYGAEYHLPKLKKRAADVTLLNDNVLHVTEPKVDVVLAMNFSYFCFKERKQLLAYFRAAYDSLGDEGMMFLDAYGGWEAHEPMEEERQFDGFTYVWDQHYVDPINSHVINYIHFRFPDGSELDKAFEYDWRLWSLKEIRELLEEAGFRKSGVYWEGWDEEKEEGDGKFIRTAAAENCAGWVCYIVAEK
ncbi:MAG: class I SAM-dependent methyltransferase [Planctomycetes bacterium]|nr:class I SAM-dependent methyltransferase [Planctomycetota bacterium]